MDINSIVELVSIGISAVALLIALIKSRGRRKEYTIEELANKVNSKVQKYVDKQCKKNKIEISDLTNKVEE